jgi:hypothetical protein
MTMFSPKINDSLTDNFGSRCRKVTISQVRVRLRVRISDFSLSPSPKKWPGPKSSDFKADSIYSPENASRRSKANE